MSITSSAHQCPYCLFLLAFCLSQASSFHLHNFCSSALLMHQSLIPLSHWKPSTTCEMLTAHLIIWTHCLAASSLLSLMMASVTSVGFEALSPFKSLPFPLATLSITLLKYLSAHPFHFPKVPILVKRQFTSTCSIAHHSLFRLHGSYSHVSDHQGLWSIQHRRSREFGPQGFQCRMCSHSR